MDNAPLPGDHSKGAHGSRFNHRDFGYYVRRLREDPDEWFGSKSILEALEANSCEPIPQQLKEYLLRRLDREVPMPRGRKPGSTIKQTHRYFIQVEYRRYLDWLTARKKSVGLRGWSLIRDVEWWQGPPSERAARMVKKRFARSITWERVRQIALGD